MEKWLEGHEIAQTLIPRFNKLPLGFFDGSRRRSVRGGELALSARVGQNEAKRNDDFDFPSRSDEGSSMLRQ